MIISRSIHVAAHGIISFLLRLSNIPWCVCVHHIFIHVFPSGSAVKNPPAVLEMWTLSLGRKDPLEKEMATHSSILVWKNPMNRGAWQATVHKVAKSWTLSTQEYHHVGNQFAYNFRMFMNHP